MNLNQLLKLDDRPIILASGSPRRASLFELMGLQFEVQVSDVDENSEEYLVPEVHVLELSYKKASKVAEVSNDGLIVGADTIVVLDDETLGKPSDRKDAHKILRRLSSRTHAVYTGYTIIEKPSGRSTSEYARTEVTFRELTDIEIEAYIATGSPMDKAGAYGIQDHGALFVTKVEGCFYNVMGFPITSFYQTLTRFLGGAARAAGA